MRLSPTARYALAGTALTALLLGTSLVAPPPSEASSHREAPLIADDPLADNTDVYAFRSPDAPGTVTLIANFIPFQLPDGGPNYNHWGEDVRYEIHVKNKTSVGALGSATDDITYRFTFTRTNQDPTTFFNIRLGQENLKTTYRLEKSVGGAAFTTVVSNGVVPPPNIGPRSIESGVGLGTTYEALTTSAIARPSATGAKSATRASAAASGAASCAPPYAPAKMPTSVIPTWTVARKRFGRAASASAARAPRSPSSARFWRRPLRDETTASSDIEKTPLSTISARMSRALAVVESIAGRQAGAKPTPRTDRLARTENAAPRHVRRAGTSG